MLKLRAAIEGKDQWQGLISHISLVESNRERNPNIALDGAKSILETISKTILINKGVVCKDDLSIGALVKLAFKNIPVFTSLEAQDAECSTKILSALSTVCSGLGEFRNSYGFFSHGTDLHAQKFDRYLVELSIGASDLLASFLILAHSEDHKDRSRYFYEDYPEFNRMLDDEGLEVRGIPLDASFALFNGDIEAYKAQLIEFINNKAQLIDDLEKSGNFRSTHLAIAGLDEYINYLSRDEVQKILQASENNDQVSWIRTDEDVALFYGKIDRINSAVMPEEI